MERAKLINILVGELGETYSKSLGINLLSRGSDEIFKWFLASLLFGARISKSIARKTYKEFEKKKIVSPEKIMDTGWDGLVAILDEGGYVRYDFKTATKLLEITGNFLKEYKGNKTGFSGYAWTQNLAVNGKNSNNKGINIRLLQSFYPVSQLNLCKGKYLNDKQGEWRFQCHNI